jgi:hypothetical protein
MRKLSSFLGAMLLSAEIASAQRPVEVAPNAPADQPLRPRAWCQWNAAVRAMEPYIAQARSTYPAARERFLRGLPPHHTFFVTARVKDSAGRVEQVFVAVDTIQSGRITGRIWSNLERAIGFRRGQRYDLSERDLIDWMIARPDGSEEGNVVGKFLDVYRPPDCTDARKPTG